MTTRDAAGGGGEGREGGGGVVSWRMCDVERLGMGSKLRVDSLEGRDWVGELMDRQDSIEECEVGNSDAPRAWWRLDFQTGHNSQS
jgi:hypothetical protein